MRTVDCGGGAIYMTEFNPRGTHAVVSTGDNALKVVDVATGRVTLIDDSIGYVTNVDFSPDGRWMCGPAGGNSGGAIVIWDARSWKETRRLEMEQPRTCLGVFSDDGRTVATTSTDGTLQLWNVQTGKMTATLSTELHGLAKLRFAPNGRSLVVAGPTLQVNVFGLAGDPRPVPEPAPPDASDTKNNSGDDE